MLSSWVPTSTSSLIGHMLAQLSEKPHSSLQYNWTFLQDHLPDWQADFEQSCLKYISWCQWFSVHSRVEFGIEIKKAILLWVQVMPLLFLHSMINSQCIVPICIWRWRGITRVNFVFRCLAKKFFPVCKNPQFIQCFALVVTV